VASCLILLTPAGAPAAQLPAGAVVVVLPLETPGTDPQEQWLGEGLAVLLTDVLSSAGVTVVDRDDRVLAFDRLQLPSGVALSRASSIRVGQVVGATLVVGGQAALEGETLSLVLRAVRLDEGRLLPEMAEKGSVTDLFAIALGLGRRLIGASEADTRWQPPLCGPFRPTRCRSRPTRRPPSVRCWSSP
jgi:TolB-like protein